MRRGYATLAACLLHAPQTRRNRRCFSPEDLDVLFDDEGVVEGPPAPTETVHALGRSLRISLRMGDIRSIRAFERRWFRVGGPDLTLPEVMAKAHATLRHERRCRGVVRGV